MMTEVFAVLAFAALFAVFGLVRPRAGCSGDPAGCGRCGETCTKDRSNKLRNDLQERGRRPADPPREVHR